jgi:hypothetical protein
MEGLIRKIVWFFREKPRTAYTVTALTLVAILSSGLLLYVAKQRRLTAAETRLLAAKMSGAGLRRALAEAWKKALDQKAVSPLLTGRQVVIEAAGIPVRI